MKHFVVIANAYKDRDFALTNKIVAYIEQKGGLDHTMNIH